MKTVGIIGGMSPESTVSYYADITAGVRKKLGGLHSGRIVLYSVDFAEIEQLQQDGRWADAGRLLGAVAAKLEATGVDFLIIATNTMHAVFAEVQAAVSTPILHIAEPTGAAIFRDQTPESARATPAGRPRVGLIGTRYTMEQDFYRGYLERNFGIDVVAPEEEDRQLLQRIIFDELCVGNVTESSRAECLRIIDSLSSAGAEAVILGCTEIGLLVRQTDTSVRLYDTTSLHVEAAVDRIVETADGTFVSAGR